jgi:pimeloyl-ACP methyl ester carboxylesterase
VNAIARRYTSSDGLSLHYVDWAPAGPDRRIDVLCLAGLTRHANDFDDVAPPLASLGHRVVCPDLRGRGRSDYAQDPASYAPPQYFDDLRALAIASRLGEIAVIGTSFGGLLAMALASVMPGTVRGVAMNDIGPEIAPSGAGRILDYISVDRVQPDWDAASIALREFLPNVLTEDPAGWAKLVRNTYREGTDGKLHFDWDTRLSATLKPGPDPEIDLWALWRGVADIPVLAVRGGKSDVLSAEIFAKMKATKRDLMQLELPGIGHTPTLDEPASRLALDIWLARIET